jgi:RNA polymerase I-specific transcription-initiation factor
MKVTNILIYSRSNAVITVHQLVQDIALTWADTPSLLPLPRFEKNSMKPMPNLGLIVIPSEKVLHAQDPDSSEIPSFTTYHLTSDLNIIGDMYAKEVDFVHDLTEFGVDQSKKRNSVSSNPDSDSESSGEDWISEREFDFTEVAKIVLPTIPPTEVIPQVTLLQLKRNILEQIESRRDLPFETMYPPIMILVTRRLHTKSPDMIFMNLDALASTIEQIAHQVQENGMNIRHLQVPTTPDEDPEDDTGSISWIYNSLLSTFPSKGLTTNEIRRKVQSIRETAIDVGLSNIGVLKSDFSPADNNESLHNLGKFIHIDTPIPLSDAAKYLLNKWDEPAHPVQAQLVNVPKRRRVRLPASQEGMVVDPPSSIMGKEMAPMTMSQPERGRHGVRNLRPKTRRSGF